jgi:hypothetical protein
MTGNARKYIDRIKNDEKRAFAEDYFTFLLGGPRKPFFEDTREYKLSTMARQAVRMNLDEIMDND